MKDDRSKLVWTSDPDAARRLRDDLATRLKKRCGAGGAARGNEIEIQGDHSATIAAELSRHGYKTST